MTRPHAPGVGDARIGNDSLERDAFLEITGMKY